MGGWYYEEWKTVISLRSRRGRSNRRRGRILQPRLINALNWQTIWTHNRRNRNRKKTPTGITFKNLLFVFSPLNISSNFSFIKIWLKPSEISLSQIFFFFFSFIFSVFQIIFLVSGTYKLSNVGFISAMVSHHQFFFGWVGGGQSRNLRKTTL